MKEGKSMFNARTDDLENGWEGRRLMQQWSHGRVNTSERCLIRTPTSGLPCSKPESRSPAMGESSQAAEEKVVDEQRRTAPSCKDRHLDTSLLQVHLIAFDSGLRAPGIITGQSSMVPIQISVKCEFELSHVRGTSCKG
jgi:hypothetical protein